jgi:hypothetical protein
MAREGQHDAQLRIRGDASSADKELRNLATRMNQVESATTKQNNAFTKLSAKTKQAETDMTKWGQSAMETRGRIMGQVGAIVAAAVAVDRLADRSRELAKAQGINSGLAFEWEKMTKSLTAGIDKLVLAVNNLPAAVRTAGEDIGVLGEKTEDTTAATEEGASWWDTYAYALGAFGVIAKESIDLAVTLADKINDLTPKLANPALGTAMGNIAKAAKDLQAVGLIKIMDRQNAEMERSIEMLEANAMAAGIVQSSLDKPRPRAGKSAAAPTQFGEAFQFTPDAIDEMQGGMRAEREALSQHADDYLDRWTDFQQRKADLQLESDLQRLAMRQEADQFREPWERIDPSEAIALERDAQLQHIDNLRRMTDDEVELERLKNRERLVYHQAHVKRLEVERQAELKKWRTTAEVASAIAQITQGGVQTAAMATDMFIVNEQRREKARYVTGAVSALVTGIEQQVQAIAAFASFNYVQGALHQAAAIFAFAQSGMLFAKAGGAGRVSGAGGGSMGAMGGGGGAANGPANGRGGEGLQNQIQSDVPPSQAPTANGPSSSSQGQQSGNVMFMGPVHLYGTPQGEFVDGMARALETRGRNTRRAV